MCKAVVCCCFSCQPLQSRSSQGCSWQRRLENKICLAQLLVDILAKVVVILITFCVICTSIIIIKCLPNFLTILEELKQKITSSATWLRNYKCRVLHHKQNSLFRNNEKAFYSSLQKDISKDLPYPDLLELQSFWQDCSRRTVMLIYK